MKVLVINAGSSSLKYQVIDMDTETMICIGLVERIGVKNSLLAHKKGSSDLKIKALDNHTIALQLVISLTHKEYGVVNDISKLKPWAQSIAAAKILTEA